MIRVLWALTRGYRLRPWASPYLRWRIETYSGLHAEEISFPDFWRFAWRQRADLARYLRWAAKMSRATAKRAAAALPAGDGSRSGAGKAGYNAV